MFNLNKKLILPTITSLLFAGSFVAAKYSTLDLGPLTTSLLRYLIALLFLSILAFHRGWKSIRIEKKDILSHVMLGLTGIVGYHYFFFTALRYTDVANTAIINAFSPMVTGLMAAIFIKERLELKNYIGIVTAALGVLIIITKGEITSLFALNFNLGDMLMLCSVINWVIYSLIIKKLLHKYDGYTVTYFATCFGVILLMLLATTENFASQLNSISIVSVWSVVYMGIAASGIGYLLYNYSIKEIGPTRTSSLVYSIVPIFVAVLAFIFFDENITFIMIGSICLVLAGLRLMMAGKVN
ncbi:DMT family transporter [Bacteroidota bacterium]